MPEEIVDIDIEKYDNNTGVIELKVQNISPYEIEHSMVCISYGGATKFISINNLLSGDDAIVQKAINPGLSESAIQLSLFEIKFKDCNLKMHK